ncbi:exonuclease VII large subunit [Pedobacter sp. W3I1]|nr:exonuclease VII large subunit [Pedobacter sp. W3I1]
MTDSKIGVISTEANAEWRDLWTMLKDLSTAVEMTIYLACHPTPLFFAKKN